MHKASEFFFAIFSYFVIQLQRLQTASHLVIKLKKVKLNSSNFYGLVSPAKRSGERLKIVKSVCLNLLYEEATSSKHSGHKIVVNYLLNSKLLNNYQANTSDLNICQFEFLQQLKNRFARSLLTFPVNKRTDIRIYATSQCHFVIDHEFVITLSK